MASRKSYTDLSGANVGNNQNCGSRRTEDSQAIDRPQVNILTLMGSVRPKKKSQMLLAMRETDR